MRLFMGSCAEPARYFSVNAGPARSPARPPTGRYAMGGPEGERGGLDSARAGRT